MHGHHATICSIMKWNWFQFSPEYKYVYLLKKTFTTKPTPVSSRELLLYFDWTPNLFPEWTRKLEFYSNFDPICGCPCQDDKTTLDQELGTGMRMKRKCVYVGVWKQVKCKWVKVTPSTLLLLSFRLSFPVTWAFSLPRHGDSLLFGWCDAAAAAANEKHHHSDHKKNVRIRKNFTKLENSNLWTADTL